MVVCSKEGLQFVILLPQPTRSELQASNAVLDSEVSFCFQSVMPYVLNIYNLISDLGVRGREGIVLHRLTV